MMQLPAGKHRESMGQLHKSTTQVPPAHHKYPLPTTSSSIGLATARRKGDLISSTLL